LEKTVTCTRREIVNLLKYASENRDEGFFNVVTINVDGVSISASRMVLAFHSHYFEKMFKTNMKEKYESLIEIQGVKGSAVKAIIDYFYTESIDINSEVVMNLLVAADYLQADDVKEFCSDYLESIVCPENSITILNAAKLFHITSLKSKV